ncbi:phosphotransferase [Nocardioides lentus]|uniref:Maltokinase n=1 Tax=Nocardioides lentus TaxID=338077 RepID=A0ABN2PSM4_9ACTN
MSAPDPTAPDSTAPDLPAPDLGAGSIRASLADYLVRTRWFAGKGRDFAITDVRELGRLPGDAPQVRLLLVDVEYAEGTDADRRETYQVPLSCYAEPQEALEYALVATWPAGADAPVQAYDALHDRAAMAAWLTAFSDAFEAPDKVLRTDTGLAFHRLPFYTLDETATSLLFTGEQSNSSVAFGEDSLMKVFRKVTTGINPDIAIHEVLTRASSEHVAALYGWLETAEPTSGEPLQLAMIQQFLRTASDGWELGLASVRNLFAEADLHADEVGGDFAAESARLGVALAEVHETLAEHFPTATADRAAMGGLAAAMARRLDEALPVVPGLADHADALRSLYEDVASLEGVRVQRVHGDLHLGQTLRTVRGWKIVDFEGEPAKPLGERVLPDSPWRDVAGMLRSFDYVPRVVQHTIDDDEGEGAHQRAYRAAEWADRNRAAFLSSYAGRDLTDAEQALLSAYVADKAVYETVYETRNRPTWVSIPLAAIARIGAR